MSGAGIPRSGSRRARSRISLAELSDTRTSHAVAARHSRQVQGATG